LHYQILRGEGGAP